VLKKHFWLLSVLKAVVLLHIILETVTTVIVETFIWNRNLLQHYKDFTVTFDHASMLNKSIILKQISTKKCKWILACEKMLASLFPNSNNIFAHVCSLQENSLGMDGAIFIATALRGNHQLTYIKSVCVCVWVCVNRCLCVTGLTAECYDHMAHVVNVCSGRGCDSVDWSCLFGSDWHISLECEICLWCVSCFSLQSPG